MVRFSLEHSSPMHDVHHVFVVGGRADLAAFLAHATDDSPAWVLVEDAQVACALGSAGDLCLFLGAHATDAINMDRVRAAGVLVVAAIDPSQGGTLVAQVVARARSAASGSPGPVAGEHRVDDTEDRRPFVHPSATIHPSAVLGAGTKVWHYTHVDRRAVVGRDCTLGQSVYVGADVRLGSRVKVQNHVSIYTGVEIHDDVFLGPSCVFTNVMNPRSHVDRRADFQRTVVERGASVGANATIVCGARLGAYAFVGAGAVVTRDVAPYAQVVGVPARAVGFRCQCGEPLQVSTGSAAVSCGSCGARYAVGVNGLSPMSSA